MESIQLPQRRASRLLAVLAALAGTAALTAAPAAADAGSGTATLTFAKQSKATSLSAQGVKVLSVGAKGGSTVKAGTQSVELALAELSIAGNSAKALTASKLKFSLGKRKALFGDLAFDIAGDSTSVSAKLGKRQLVLFRAPGAAAIDASSVKLDGASLRLTGNAARAIKARLGLDALASGKVGSLGLESKLTAPAARPVTPEPPKKVDPPKPDPYPYGEWCPVASVEGPGGFAKPPATVSGIAPAPLFNPGTSQDVTGGSAAWGFRTSFRNYVLNVDSPPMGSLPTLDGAAASAVGPGMAAPGQFFYFPMTAGDYERGVQPDHSDDKLVADGTGTVLFCKPDHGFNVVLKNPTAIIDGEDSRIVADVGANMNGTWYPFQRADIAELDLSLVEPEITDSGNSIEWENIPAKLTADGALAMGIYKAGDALDPITVKTSLQRPLLAECAVDAGTAAPVPAVGLGLADLPVLTSPVTGSGGTINWGFRQKFRSTIKTNGSFVLLGGASEGYPGNMGGGETAAPEGGFGKFFRFPISEYAYDDMTAAPDDDRLIATSEATVGFCNPKHGYAAVLSKPTLVIDGLDSRFIANVYSFQKNKGWMGGRVDLVDLNATGVNAVAGSGTVSWGEVLANENPLNVGIPVDGGFSTEALTLAAMAVGTSAGTFDPIAAQIVLPTP